MKFLASKFVSKGIMQNQVKYQTMGGGYYTVTECFYDDNVQTPRLKRKSYFVGKCVLSGTSQVMKQNLGKTK